MTSVYHLSRGHLSEKKNSPLAACSGFGTVASCSSSGRLWLTPEKTTYVMSAAGKKVSLRCQGLIRRVFLTRPFTGTINDPLVWKNFAFDYNAVTVEVATEEAAMVIDLYTSFKDRPEFFSDESHFTADGHRLAAEIVADHLRGFLSNLARE